MGFGARGAATSVVRADGTAGIAVVIGDGERVGPLAALAPLRHPGLPPILEIAPLHGGGAALVMEPVVGPSLATLVEARGPLTAGEVAEVWSVLADALAALHARGIVHGDVSPPNVVITDAGPVLLDIAGHGGREIGRYGYVPPEVLGGGRPGEASDVWALARVLAWASGDSADVLAALGAALDDDPASRPSARAFTTWHHLLGTAVPVAVPEASRLAAAHLRAVQRPTVLVPADARRPWGLIAMVAAAVVAAVVLVRAGHAEAGAAGAITGADEVTALLAERDRALGAGDADALEEVYVPGSAALAADLAAIEALAASGLTLEGYSTSFSATAGVACGEELCVEGTVTQEEHQRRGADGTVTVVPAQEGGCVRVRIAEGRVGDITRCEG